MTSQTSKASIIIIISFILFLPLLSLSQETNAKIKVVTEQANIRQQPAIDSPIIHQAMQDDVLEVLDKQGEWYRVIFLQDSGEATTGFVHESLVKVISGATEIVKQPVIKPIGDKKPVIKKPQPKKETPAKTKVQKPVIQKPIPEKKPASSEWVMPDFGFRLSIGTSYITGGQLNEGAIGLGDYYGETLGITGEHKIKPVHFSYLVSSDIFLPLFDKFTVGFGFDYFRGELESAVKFDRTDFTDYYSARPRVEALPFRVYAAYHPNAFIFLKIGIEYYFTQIQYYYRYQTQDFWQQWSGSARGHGFGFLGGMGYEYEIAPFAKLFVEVVGRYSKIKGFKGTDNYRESTDHTHSETGKLYFYQGQVGEEKTVPLLYIRERKPAEAWVLDTKEAIIDFSGVTLRAGIGFRF
jgi:hypothetical protein